MEACEKGWADLLFAVGPLWLLPRAKRGLLEVESHLEIVRAARSSAFQKARESVESKDGDGDDVNPETRLLESIDTWKEIIERINQLIRIVEDLEREDIDLGDENGTLKGLNEHGKEYGSELLDQKGTYVLYRLTSPCKDENKETSTPEPSSLLLDVPDNPAHAHLY